MFELMAALNEREVTRITGISRRLNFFDSANTIRSLVDENERQGDGNVLCSVSWDTFEYSWKYRIKSVCPFVD
jgi:hypothetical protein